MSFVLARHGYRSSGNINPGLTIDLGPTVCPSMVKMPFFDGAFPGTLLNDTLSATLPSIVNNTKKLIFPCVDEIQLHSKTYADTATSRCQMTAVEWAEYLNAREICGVPTRPGIPIDPRVTYQAAEKNLDQGDLINAQHRAADEYKEKAQSEWSTLLELLGFTQTDEQLPIEHNPGDSKSRTLHLLGLPQTSFDLATTVIMSFALQEATSEEILKYAEWPKPTEKDQQKWFYAAGALLGTIMAVWYPVGYAADAMSAPIAQFMLNWFNANGSKDNLLVAVAHEEQANYLMAALGLGLFYYAVPTSCILFVKENDTLKINVIRNEIKKSGSVSRKAEVETLADVSFEILQRLAAIEIQPLPDFVCKKIN